MKSKPNNPKSNPLKPQGFAMNVTRPSTEMTRPTDASDDGEERLFQWLENMGIPFFRGRLMKKAAKKHMDSLKSSVSESSENEGTATTGASAKSDLITASNVSPAELETYYSWKFYGEVFALEEAVLINSGNDLLREMNEVFQPILAGNPTNENCMFSLPQEWQRETITKNSPFDAFWRDILLRFLSIHDPDRKFINFAPSAKIEKAEYPTPSVLTFFNSKYSTQGVGWSVMNILAGPTFTEPLAIDTEMEVERLNGSKLSSAFSIPECKTTSNRQVSYITPLLCFGSYAKADYAVRPQHGTLPANLRLELYPVILLGEAKKTKVTKGKPNKADQKFLTVDLVDSPGEVPMRGTRLIKNRMVSQLAFSAHSSLVIIIASLIHQWKTSSTKGDYQVPSYAVIYSIAYGSNGLLIYAFFPVIVARDKKRFPTKWGFASVLVTSLFSEVFTEKTPLKTRARVIQVLLILQQQAIRLKNKMKSLELPPEFLI